MTSFNRFMTGREALSSWMHLGEQVKHSFLT